MLNSLISYIFISVKTCPALPRPKNGNMICDKDGFPFSTVCRFTCDTGYKLVGSRKRECLAIAAWTGINTRCRGICPTLSFPDQRRHAIKNGQSRATGNIWYRRRRKTKQKHNTICVGHHYAQAQIT